MFSICSAELIADWRRSSRRYPRSLEVQFPDKLLNLDQPREDTFRPFGDFANNFSGGLDFLYQADSLSSKEVHGFDIASSIACRWNSSEQAQASRAKLTLEATTPGYIPSGSRRTHDEKRAQNAAVF
jgi:hypothetical protein